MSDVKARAEERRKKILARTNKQVSAVAADEDGVTEPSNDEPSPTPKVNPLRKRREFVEAVAAKVEEEKLQAKEAEILSAANTPVKDASDDPSVESIDEMTKIVKSTSTNSIDTSSTTPKKEIVYVKKTMKEIEEEVAINTKKFDEGALKKEEKRESPAVAAAAAAKKPKVKVASNVQPSNIMRLIRMLLIVLLGTSIAYHTVKTHKDAELSLTTANSLNLAAKNVAFDEFAPDATFVDTEIVYDSTPVQEKRTWLGYIVFKLRSQIECTITAVGLVWWVSRSVSPLVNNTFKVAPVQGGNIMSTLLNMYQSGFEGIFEIAYSALGELALFLFVIIIAVVGFTVLYTDTIGSTSVESVTNEL